MFQPTPHTKQAFFFFFFNFLLWQGPRFALWRHMCNRKYSRKFVDDLINSFLIEELVPDVLIDVLVGKKFLVSPITFNCCLIVILTNFQETYSQSPISRIF